jgi:hypothetical protein
MTFPTYAPTNINAADQFGDQFGQNFCTSDEANSILNDFQSYFSTNHSDGDASLLKLTFNEPFNFQIGPLTQEQSAAGYAWWVLMNPQGESMGECRAFINAKYANGVGNPGYWGQVDPIWVSVYDTPAGKVFVNAEGLSTNVPPIPAFNGNNSAALAQITAMRKAAGV